MSVGIGASGFLGIAVEDTPNTYKQPTKFVPIQSEGLQYQQETIWRRPISHQSASTVGAVDGNVHTEGDVSMEAFSDVLPYFLLAARTSVQTIGTGPPFTYTFTPTPQATATKTLSITTSRNNLIFGYTGCVVSSGTFTIDNGLLMFNMSMLGSDEQEQTAPTPTWPERRPYGAGHYNLQIPTATQVFDTDSFELQINNNAEAQFRLKNTGRGAEFIQYGENEVTLSVERDFENRTEYDAFKQLTAKSITMEASNGSSDSVSFVLPVSIVNEYTVGLSGQGDLLRASVGYNGVIDDNGDVYSISVTTDEDLSTVLA